MKIAKDLKKHLVEANKLEIPQEEVNDTLFEFMVIIELDTWNNGLENIQLWRAIY